MKKVKILTEKDGKTMTSVILNVTLPALIFKVFSNVEISLSLIFLPFIAIGHGLIVLSITLLIYRKYSIKNKGLFIMTSIGFNIGLFAYPLIEGIWGTEGMQYALMFDLGNSFVIFILVYFIGLYFSSKIDFNQEKKLILIDILKRILKSIPLIALISAVIFNILNIQLPIFIVDFLDILSRANIALTLLLLGILFNINFEKSHWKHVSLTLMIRYILGFIFGIIWLIILPFGIKYNLIILVVLILPIGMTAIAFSVEFGYDENIATTMVNLSNILSFIFMWFIVISIGIF